MVGPSSFASDEAVAADAGESETPFGIGGDLRRRRDRDPREVLPLELVARPFLGPGGFEPGAEVVPVRGADLQHLEGRARDRLPFEVDDLAGDRPVVDQSERQVVAPASAGNLHPGEPVVRRRRRDDGLVRTEFHVLDRSSGRRSARNRKRPSGPVVADSCDCVRLPVDVDRRRAVDLRAGDRPAIRPEHPAADRRSSRASRAGSGPGCGAAASAFRCIGGSGLAADFFEGSSWSETRAADAPHAIRPAARRVADANVSFWSNMILSTSRVNSLAAAETTPTVIV